MNASTDTAKFTRMHEILDQPIERFIATIDNGGATKEDGAPYAFTPALFAGLSTAKVLLAHAQYTALGDDREGGWGLFRSRLQFALDALTGAQDTGQPTQFGLWDGMHFAAVEAGKIDNETVAPNGQTVAQEDQAPGA